MLQHVVQFSTGAGSAEVAWRVVKQFGRENVVLLTADTRVEDEDNWRFTGLGTQTDNHQPNPGHGKTR